MPIPFYVAMFFLLFILFLIVGYYALTLFNETELLGARLRRVSQMLQKAELDTGVPYFTSLGKYIDVENPTMFLIAKRRAVFQPVEEEEEEQEQEEQEQEEQEQEEEQGAALDRSSESEPLSDEGDGEGAVSETSNTSQVVPPPAPELDLYVPLFSINKEE